MHSTCMTHSGSSTFFIFDMCLLEGEVEKRKLKPICVISLLIIMLYEWANPKCGTLVIWGPCGTSREVFVLGYLLLYLKIVKNAYFSLGITHSTTFAPL